MAHLKRTPIKRKTPLRAKKKRGREPVRPLRATGASEQVVPAPRQPELWWIDEAKKRNAFDGVNRSAGPRSFAEAAAMPSTQRVNHGWAPCDGRNQRAEEQDRAEGTVVVIGPKADEAGEMTIPPGTWTVAREAYVGPTGRWQMDLVPATPEPKRKGPWRSPDYLTFVRSKPCCVCGAAGPSEAHHWSGKGRGAGQKVSDAHVSPLCRRCHRDWHDRGAFKAHIDAKVRGIEGWDTREGSEAIQVEAQRNCLAEWVAR